MIYPTLPTASATLRTFVQKASPFTDEADVTAAVLFVCGYVNCLTDHFGVESDEFGILENWAVDITQNVDPESDLAGAIAFLKSYPFLTD